MDWAAGLTFVPRNALAVGACAVALAAVVPALAARQWLLVPFLGTVTALGTLVYVRYGLVVVTGRCETCGERSYVGAVWCPRTGAVRTALSRPVVHAVLAVALFVVLGTVAGAARTVAPWVAANGPPHAASLSATGDPFFEAFVLLAATVAAVPIPVVAGNAIRLSFRKTSAVAGTPE